MKKNELKKIQNEIERKAKQIIREGMGNVGAPGSVKIPKPKKISTRSDKTKADKKKTKRELTDVQKKAKRLARNARKMVENAVSMGFKFKSHHAQELYEKRISEEYITKYIKTEDDYKKYISHIGKKGLSQELNYVITTIKHPVSPNGERLKEKVPIMNYDAITSPAKAAQILNKMLNYKVPVTVNGIKTMRHITSFTEANLLSEIIFKLTGKEATPGMKTEYFEISDEWNTKKKYKDLSLYIKFKKVPIDKNILSDIQELAQSPFTRKELYKIYREKVMRHDSLKGLDDNTIAIISKFIDDNLLWRICERDCDPSDVKPMHDSIYEGCTKLYNTNTNFFDEISVMIDNSENAYEIKDRMNELIGLVKKNKSNKVTGG